MANGFTVLELLVASAIGLTILTIVLSSFMANRRVVKYDLERTALNQNVRSALDIMGINIRLAGENLPSSFPAIEVIDGGANPDELILRRNLFDEVLKLCQSVSAGSSTDFFFAIAGVTSGCIYSDQTQNVSTWQQYLTDEGGLAQAFVYDPANDVGEFFEFDNLLDGTTELSLELAPGESWDNLYPVGQSAGYILEQWHFYMQDDLLMMEINEDTANANRITFGLTDLQITVHMADGSTQTSLTSSDNWTEVNSLEISITGDAQVLQSQLDRTLVSRFFPRNVLSN